MNQEDLKLMRRLEGSFYQEEKSSRPSHTDMEESEKMKMLVSWGFMTSNHPPHSNTLKLSLVQLQSLEHQIVNPSPLIHLLIHSISHSVVSSKYTKPPATLNHLPGCSGETVDLKLAEEEAQLFTVEHVQLLLDRKGKERERKRK